MFCRYINIIVRIYNYIYPRERVLISQWTGKGDNIFWKARRVSGKHPCSPHVHREKQARLRSKPLLQKQQLWDYFILPVKFDIILRWYKVLLKFAPNHSIHFLNGWGNPIQKKVASLFKPFISPGPVPLIVKEVLCNVAHNWCTSDGSKCPIDCSTQGNDLRKVDHQKRMEFLLKVGARINSRKTQLFECLEQEFQQLLESHFFGFIFPLFDEWNFCSYPTFRKRNIINSKVPHREEFFVTTSPGG